MKYFVGSFAALVLFFIGSATAGATGLSAPEELGGWAWSSTIGWISMNCANTSNCASDGGVDYAVSINPDGSVTGFAWSSNIGWIQFGGLWDFPTGGATLQDNALVTGIYPDLEFDGWARACAGTAPGDCSNMDSRTDGWDGWISLHGANYTIRTDTSGVMSGGDINGYCRNTAAADSEHKFARHFINIAHATTRCFYSWAWGSDVVGWIDFAPVTFGVAPSPPFVDLSATPTQVATSGDSSLLTYVVRGTGSGDCVASNDQAATDWGASTVLNSSGNGTASVVVGTDTTYTLTCHNAQGTTTDSVTVTIGSVPPPATPPPATLTPVAINATRCGLDTVSPPPATTGLCGPTPVTLEVRNDSGRPITSAEVFDYEFSYREINPAGSWFIADTGTYSGDVPDGGTFTVSGSISGLPEFGAYEVRGTIDSRHRSMSLTRDPFPETLPVPTPDDTIHIGPGFGPSNTYGTFSIFTGPGATTRDFIRPGTQVPVSWIVDSSLPLNCEVSGPGVSASFVHDPETIYPPTVSTDSTGSPVMSSVLNNTSVYQLRCTPVAFNRFTPDPSIVYVAEAVVEVIPTYQEI